LGSAQAAGEFLHSIVEMSDGTEQSLRSAARERLVALHSKGQPIPGFGHPLHKRADPRAEKVLAIAGALGTRGPYARAATTIEELIPKIVGRQLRLNISGVIPAVLLDVGYPLGALKGVPLLARAASLIAHLLEEQQRPIGFLIADAAARAVTYDGPAPTGFRAAEE
jgi:citrate synthase